MSKSYLEPFAHNLPDPTVVTSAPDVKISYIGARPAGDQVTLTANLTMRLTHHFADAEVRPGQLDVVLVPGPDPKEPWDPAALAWLAAQLASEGTDVLSVCTGIYICGEAGLLKGRTACGPQFMQADIKARFEGVELVGGERRWVRDGNFWSSGESLTGKGELDLSSSFLLFFVSPSPSPILCFVVLGFLCVICA